MKKAELVEGFIAHAPQFYDDLDLPEIDDKHSVILKQAYEQFEDQENLRNFDFRSWKAQNDLSVPAQFSLRRFRASSPPLEIAKYVYRKLFRRDVDRALLDGLLDDIEIIKRAGGEDLLRSNPVHQTPGARQFYFVDGVSVSFRWLRYIYLLKRILDSGALTDEAVWVDVGSYYGGLQGLVRKYCPGTRTILVDFHHQLCRSYLYLSELYPDARHVLPDEVAQLGSFEEAPKGAFVYVPASEFASIAGKNATLVTNFFSLGEMRRHHFEGYMGSELFRNAPLQILVNRFVSAPSFEKTYDSEITILDYQSDARRVSSFDVFPMHHYLLVKRELFGRNRLRGLSSPYFEMTTMPV